MTQLHAVHHGLGVVRPTADVDIVLHIETHRGTPNAVATALEALGYHFQPSIDERNRSAHRFVRANSKVDVVTSESESCSPTGLARGASGPGAAHARLAVEPVRQ